MSLPWQNKTVHMPFIQLIWIFGYTQNEPKNGFVKRKLEKAFLYFFAIFWHLAVKNSHEIAICSQIVLKYGKEDIDKNKTEKLFQSGTMILNLAKWSNRNNFIFSAYIMKWLNDEIITNTFSNVNKHDKIIIKTFSNVIKHDEIITKRFQMYLYDEIVKVDMWTCGPPKIEFKFLWPQKVVVKNGFLHPKASFFLCQTL